MALSTRTKFQLEILTTNVIFGIVYFARLFWRDREMLVKQPAEIYFQDYWKMSWKRSGYTNTDTLLYHIHQEI